MLKIDIYQKELEKMREIFRDVDPAKAALAAGLMEEAAFLAAQNSALRDSLAETGMVKIHPQHKDIQKPVETARQYRQNVNTYAVLVKALNGIVQKNTVEEDDAFDDFLKEMRGE